MLLVGITLLAAFACEQSQPTFSGGKPIEHWLRAVESRDPKLRREAVRKLGNVGSSDPAAFSAVLQALNDLDPGVRREAIVAVMKFETEAGQAVPALTKLEHEDKDSRVRACARKALESIEQRDHR
jgi:HEAT repeat protein